MRGFGREAAQPKQPKRPKEKRSAAERMRGMFGKRFFAGSYSAFAAAVVIAIAVVINLIASALPADKTQIDLTDQAIYTLSDQTKRIMASLDSDVTLYLLAQSGREDETITRLLDRYASLSDHIQVTLIDPTQKPTFLDGYDLDISRLYANSVLVECGERTRLVGYDEIYVTSYEMDYYSYNYTTTTSFDGENALTNAIHYVSSGNIPKVYALTGHGETELSSSIQTLIERDNLELDSLSLLSEDSVPEDASAVVIHVPQSDLGSEEADKLIAYLDAGGRVVLITDYIETGSMENLLRVTASMGMTAGEGLIVEGDRNQHVSRYPYYLLPQIASHDITQPLLDGGYFVLTPLSQPIEETGDGEATVTTLLETSDSAYSKAAALQMQTTEKEEGDTEGPFAVAAASEKGEGRMVWVTSADLLTDSVNAMVSGANSDLFMNSLDWMCDQAETISIRAKSLDEAGLTLTQAQSSFWSAVMIGIIPGVLLIAGLAIVVRRKRR
ncbi:MAG: Gldg family protein [Clostridia bacterium]|nr:Gldg family protein [Clostridia bacterium]